jgi:hypothetical protein
VLDGVVSAGPAVSTSRRCWRRRVARLGWFMSASPVAFLAVVLLHAMHVRIYLGRWPVVYRDNPESLFLHIHEYGFLVPALYGALCGVPLWMLSGAILVVAGLLQWRVWGHQLGLMLAGMIGVILFLWFDPTGYVEWFLD